MSYHAHMFHMPAAKLLDEARVHILNPEHESMNSSAAIRASVSSVEAFLGEVAQLGTGYAKHGHSSENPLVNASNALIKAESSKQQIIPKILIVLEALSGEKPIVGSTPTLQRLTIALKVRNEITHPKAIELTLTNRKMQLPKKAQEVIRGLAAYGFKTEDGTHDWLASVTNRKFSYWTYLTCLETIEMVIDRFPYRNTINLWKELYCVNLKSPDSWPNYVPKS